jgi:hypothetical protein
MAAHPVGTCREDDVLVTCLESLPGLSVGMEELLLTADGLDAAPFVLTRDSWVETAARLEAFGSLEGVLGEDRLAAEDLPLLPASRCGVHRALRHLPNPTCADPGDQSMLAR